MQKRNVLNSPRLLKLKKHRHRIILKKIFISLFGFFAILVFLAFFSRFDILNIDQIEIIGNKVLDTEKINEVVKEQITGKYLLIFPKTNVLFYSKNNIKNELQNKFKRLKNINLSIKNNRVLEVSLIEREAKYTWCGASVPEALLMEVSISKASGTIQSEQCYFLDEDGYIFDEAPYFSGEVYFKFYGLGNLLPGSYFAKENFKKLISFKDILVNMKLKPVILLIEDDGDVQMFLSKENSSTSKPKIIFKIDSDFQNVAENLQAALATDPLKTDFKNKYSSLLYIDLRFSNKVYYKFSTQNKSTSGEN